MATKKPNKAAKKLPPAKIEKKPAKKNPPKDIEPPAEKPLPVIAQFKNSLDKYQENVLPHLLASHNIDMMQFCNIVLSEVKKSVALLQVFIQNPKSLFASILFGAEIGLMPSEALGEFYIIPRNIKQEDGTYLITATPLIGYKGIVSILLRNRSLTRIHAEVVYEGDEFEPIYGLEPNIIHKPNFNTPRTADKIRYAYAVAKNDRGEYQFTVLTRDEIIAIKNMAKYDNDLYFNDKKNPNRWMEKKAALLQLSKLLPKDYYSKKATSFDPMFEGGAYLSLDDSGMIRIIENKESKKITSKKGLYAAFSKE